MLPWLYLGTVHQTMPNSLHDRRIAAETDSLDLIKMSKPNSNVNQLEPSKTNKRRKVITSIAHSAKSQIHASGKD